MTRKTALRVAAYVRVSTSNQLMKVGGSLDSQLSQIHNTAAYKSQLAEHTDGPQWRIVDEYREEGRSGKNTDRPELQRLMNDVRAGRIDVVVVTKIDRITRSLVDFYDLWELFEKHNVEFISLGDNFETTTAIGRAMLKITLVFAELERERTSERTKEKVHARMNEGKWFGGAFPFGYVAHPDDKTTIVVDREQQQVLREHIFEKYLELPSIRSLVRYLGDKGILSPKRKGRQGQSVGGKPMSVEKVRKLLSDTRLIAKKTLDDGREIDCNWEPIIDEALFDRVQQKLPKNSGVVRPSRGTPERVYLLESLVRCGKCGSTMTYAKAKGRSGYYFYYRCSNKQRSSSTACDVRDIPAAALEDFVIDLLKNYAVDDDAMSKAVRDANAGKDSKLGSLKDDLAKLKRKRTKVQKQVDGLLNVIEDGEADTAPLLQRLKQRQAELDLLDKDIDTTNAACAELERYVLDLEVVAQGYREFPTILKRAQELKLEKPLQAVLRSVIDVIVWNEDPKNPKEGVADVQLFPIPEEVLSLSEAARAALSCSPDELAAASSEEAQENQGPIENDTAVLTQRFLRCHEWLPRTDSNRRLGG